MTVAARRLVFSAASSPAIAAGAGLRDHSVTGVRTTDKNRLVAGLAA